MNPENAVSRLSPENAVSRLSPGMAECHARLMAVAKHGTPEAFSATLAGVLQRAELSISNAYDAGAKSIQVDAAAAPNATTEFIKAFREYLTVHPNIKLGGHEADTVARELALIAQPAVATEGHPMTSPTQGEHAQPEALRLADWLEAVGGGPSAKRCAALLREQHARIAELEAQLASIGAGGVSGPLMGRTHSKEREALVAYLKDCDAHDIVPDVGGAWRAAFHAASAGSEPVASAAQAALETLERTHQSLARQLDLIAERAPGNFLDKRPVVNTLTMHQKRTEAAAVALRSALDTHPSPPEGMVGGWRPIASFSEDEADELLAWKPELGRIMVTWLPDGHPDADEGEGWHEAWSHKRVRGITHACIPPAPPTTSAGSGKGE